MRNKKRAVSSEIGEMMLDGNCKMVSKQVRKISPIRQSKSVMVRVTPEVWNAKVGNYDQQLINAILRHAKRSLEANKK